VLGPAHAEAGFALSAEAGWNQTVEDWRLMIRIGEAWGQVTAAGELVASALILPYDDRVAWIGMVLTRKAWRRRGLASANLGRALARCTERGLIAGLDATPAGREVYRPHGFRDLWPLHRLLARDVRAGGAHPPAGVAIRPATRADLPGLVALDTAAFGAPRPEVLAHLLAAQPARARVATEGNRIVGTILARDGRLALHLGPLTATRPDVAAPLAAAALAGAAGPVSIDVPDLQGDFVARLGGWGFAPVRPFMRMLRESADLGRPALTFALAGPELG